MSDTPNILVASLEKASTSAGTFRGTEWASGYDQPECTIGRTNLQIAGSLQKTLSRSSDLDILPVEPLLVPAPLFSSSSKSSLKTSTRLSRKARSKDLNNLKGWQVNDLYRADAIADRMGVGLDWLVTINSLYTEGGAADFAAQFQRGCKRAGQWLRDNDPNVPVCYIYVHENPGGLLPHSHILIHVPPHLINKFRDHVNKWFGGVNDAAVKVDRRVEVGWSRNRRLQYLIKGAHHLICEAYGAKRKKGGQGPINCKRSGVSQFLRDEFGGRYDNERFPHAKRSQLRTPLPTGDELRELRTAAGLSQADVASMAGVHRNTVTRLEKMTAASRTSGKAHKKIMRALGKVRPAS